MAIVFKHFKDDIDQHHDRRERLIKITRDITALSKKIIFALHRIPIEPISDGSAAVPKDIAKEIATIELQIQDLAAKASLDLQGTNLARYDRNMTGALQEYIEALAFRYYVQHQTIPAFEEVKALLGQKLALTEADYILGIADVTGELARRAITAISGASQASQSYTQRIAHTLRQLCMVFDTLDTRGDLALRELAKKIEVMHSSVHKVELSLFDKTVKHGTIL